ncbi:hypothetical protein [Actinoplanes aureus]|uniref:Uncharacterized protein n=1 Tax=Actinoplanes aureus TaxID=2792083 RepID=A0A931C1F7_9ACTN|nr:hypothetical protein [Actinoplanes aureus]MBG0561560.1 hypothetical protein [Actinoplanes aureus]
MTGDSPQPGEPHRDQGNPWTFADPDTAWWRDEAAGEPAEAGGSRLATAGELMIIEPDGDGASRVPERVPEKESDDRNRPTVALAPHRPPAASPAVAARLERMENSPFWLSEEERAARAAAQAARRTGKRRTSPASNPATALLALLTFGLMAAFFGWVSAEPFWLAVGHGDKGYATTTRCHGSGLTQRCTGRFAAGDGQFSVSPVTLLGVSGDGRQAGAVSPARMVSRGSTQAYAAPAGLLMHLRWALGFLLVLICGYGIAETTGARRLESRRARRRAVLASVAGPLLLLAGFLIAAY